MASLSAAPRQVDLAIVPEEVQRLGVAVREDEFVRLAQLAEAEEANAEEAGARTQLQHPPAYKSLMKILNKNHPN